MAVAVASTGLGAYSSVSSIVITKPTGLASGDLMVAIVHKRNGDVGTCSLSGWTAITSYDNTGSGDYVFALYKIADSADASASNFTFTLGETKVTGGAIMRITGFNNMSTVSTSNSGEDNINNTFQLFSNVITPVENGLIILAIMLDQGSVTQSTYYITNNNPTWAEIVDQTDSSTASMAVAWAYRPELTDTGNWGSTSSGSAKGTAIILGIGNASIVVSDTVSMSDTKNNDLGLILSDTITLTDSETDTLQKWNNTDKNTSTWVNEDKSI